MAQPRPPPHPAPPRPRSRAAPPDDACASHPTKPIRLGPVRPPRATRDNDPRGTPGRRLRVAPDETQPPRTRRGDGAASTAAPPRAPAVTKPRGTPGRRLRVAPDEAQPPRTRRGRAHARSGSERMPRPPMGQTGAISPGQRTSGLARPLQRRRARLPRSVTRRSLRLRRVGRPRGTCELARAAFGLVPGRRSGCDLQVVSLSAAKHVLYVSAGKCEGGVEQILDDRGALSPQPSQLSQVDL